MFLEEYGVSDPNKSTSGGGKDIMLPALPQPNQEGTPAVPPVLLAPSPPATAIDTNKVYSRAEIAAIIGKSEAFV
jgi:hypothetical protein